MSPRKSNQTELSAMASVHMRAGPQQRDMLGLLQNGEHKQGTWLHTPTESPVISDSLLLFNLK